MKLLNIITFLSGVLSGCVLNVYISYILSDKKFTEGKWLRCFIIAVINTVMYLFIVAVKGVGDISLLDCLMASVLLAVSVIDLHIFQIPVELNGFIMTLGLFRMMIDLQNWKEYMVGLFAVSTFLLILQILSGGQIIGGGDVKLMAACGLFLGRRDIWYALLAGCTIGVLIHLIRMKVSGTERVLAVGPYFSTGVMWVILFGSSFLK